ncbi:MAG: IPT/TIG domain-containing protein, partial [Pseudomonadota bacterium]|nr:IPT/TIG domain-containing protein [Pseudomonadota bacterium]
MTRTAAWTYLEVAQIVSLSEEDGQLGTITSILGNNLLMGGTNFTVTLANVSADVLSVSPTNITVRADSGTPSQGDVRITADTGAFTRLANGWLYGPAGTVSEIVPNNGFAGFTVTISGTNLLGHGEAIASVTLASVTASVISFNDTTVVVEALEPSDPFVITVGDVVLVSNTGATITLVDGWQYNVAGNITSVTPAQGRVGTRVEIRGTDLLGRGTEVLHVLLNGIAAEVQGTPTETLIEVAVGASTSAGSGSIEILSNSGASVELTDAWEQLPPGIITGISPDSGQYDTEITITGSFLLGGGSRAIELQLAGVDVQRILASNETEIRAVASRGTAQLGAITIVAESGARLEVANQWRYIEEGTVSSITPASGQYDTIVTIRGANLLGGGITAESVYLGDTQVQRILSDNDTVIVAVVDDATAAASEDVIVHADTGATVTGNGMFSYLARAAIDAVSPGTGQEGTTVTITGSRLRGGGNEVVSASLAAISVQSIISESNTEVIVVAAVAPDSSCDLCHPTCNECSGTGASNCTSCPDSRSLVDGVCITVCPAGSFRGEGNITVATTVFIDNVPTLVASAQAALRRVVSAAVDQRLGGDAGVVTEIVDVVSETAPQFGVRINLSVSMDQQHFEVSDGTVSSALRAAQTLTDLKAASNAFFHTESVALSSTPVRGLGSMCHECDSSCDTCIGGLESDCASCPAGFVLNGHTCVSECPEGKFFDSSYTQCRPNECAQGRYLEDADSYAAQVILTADTGAVITSAGDWTYLASGNVTSSSPATGQFGTTVTFTGRGFLGGGSTS